MIRVAGIIFFCVVVPVCLPAYTYSHRGQPGYYEYSYPSYYGGKVVLPADNHATEEGIQLGRMLFYEPALSANNQMSCSSCHQQKLAFTDGKRFSRGVDGRLQPRNTMALENLLWVRHFFWDGRAEGLEQQAAVPLTNEHEMGQALDVSAQKLEKKGIYKQLFKEVFGSNSITGEKITKALAQFERTLISANAKYDQYLRKEYTPSSSEAHGIALFFGEGSAGNNNHAAGCGHCHAGPKTFNELFHNNGLDSVFTDIGREKITGLTMDKGRFRVVSLRNIALTAPYMHDGRFATLAEVLDHYNDHILLSPTLSPFLKIGPGNGSPQMLGLSFQDKQDILAFLNMLTDSTFITDKRFSNPSNY